LPEGNVASPHWFGRRQDAGTLNQEHIGSAGGDVLAAGGF
jgi:hypothetical protein